MPTVEERLAALEARMAAWIDQQPTNYYTHQYSGEEIDAAVGRALAGGALDTSVTNVSNQLGTFVRPNLLDNWYFGDPVNQRGQTEYTASGVCTLDRWMSSTTTKTIKILDDHLSIVDTTDYSAFLQRIEYKGLLGKTVTFSVFAKCLAQGAQMPYITVMIGNNKFDGYAMIGKADDYQLSYCTVTLSDTPPSEGYFFVDVVGMVGSAIEIKAAKLEIGPTQTLAHQENGVWVLNEVPDYGEQLRRCQMDLFKIGDAVRYCSLGNGVARDSQFVSITIPTPVTMRTMPVLIAPPVGFVMRHNDTIVSGGASSSVDAFSQNSIMLKVQSQVALTPGDMWEAFLQPNGSLVFSAEL